MTITELEHLCPCRAERACIVLEAGEPSAVAYAEALAVERCEGCERGLIQQRKAKWISLDQ